MNNTLLSCIFFKFRKMFLELRLLKIFELFVTIFFQAVALFLTALLCICEILWKKAVKFIWSWEIQHLTDPKFPNGWQNTFPFQVLVLLRFGVTVIFVSSIFVCIAQVAITAGVEVCFHRTKAFPECSSISSLWSESHKSTLKQVANTPSFSWATLKEHKDCHRLQWLTLQYWSKL